MTVFSAGKRLASWRYLIRAKTLEHDHNSIKQENKQLRIHKMLHLKSLFSSHYITVLHFVLLRYWNCLVGPETFKWNSELSIAGCLGFILQSLFKRQVGKTELAANHIPIICQRHLQDSRASIFFFLGLTKFLDSFWGAAPHRLCLLLLLLIPTSVYYFNQTAAAPLSLGSKWKLKTSMHNILNLMPHWGGLR